MAKPIELSVTVTFEEDQIRDIFEGHDIKFSKAKVKRLKEMLEEVFYDVQAQLEESFEEQLAEMITDEWEQ